MSSHRLVLASASVLATALAIEPVRAQQAPDTITGRVIDATGGALPGATVTATDAREHTTTVATDATGTYVFTRLAPGRYTVRASFPGFTTYENPVVDIAAGRITTLPIVLSIAPIKEEILIQYEPTFHRGTVVVDSEFGALPDDPDDLAADLEALAGASGAPQGTQIFVDGFTAGSLPPKASVKEFRTNQNPFSAINDRVGFGRIEVFTKPGTDKLRGQASLNVGLGTFNSRNPFHPLNRPLFQEWLSAGNLGGPLGKRGSFVVDLETREIGTREPMAATILDSALNSVLLREAVHTAQGRTSVSQRLDYQMSPNNTLVGRYTHTRVGVDNAGVGGLSVPSRGYTTQDIEQIVQVTETAVLSSRLINETRLQFVRTSTDVRGNNSVPTTNVSDAFIGGGAEIGHAVITQNRWEIQNYTYRVSSAHSLRWGGRLRTAAISDISPQNFGGTFRFSGRSAPQLDAANQIVRDASGQPVLIQISGLEQYRRTVLFQGQGATAAQIRALGGGASQFSMTSGNPEARVRQTDLGVFIQDDWRVRPNIRLSLGLRYEWQTNIHFWKDFAPRVSFAWAPGGPNTKKTALRAGIGIFYDRFSEKLTLQAVRQNGLNQQQYVIRNPDFFPLVPSVETLRSSQLPPTIRRVASDLREPYVIQTSIGFERLLPFKTTVTSTVSNSRGLHLLRSRNINAPLPGTFVPGVSTSGVGPYGPGPILQYESTGILNQYQWNTNVTSRFHPSLTLFAVYVLNYARSTTDGPTTFPADSYSDRAEYGRSVLDERQRLVLGASLAAPGRLLFSPYIAARSGTPFNITTGTDINGDTLLMDRPAFATDLSGAAVVTTGLGAFDTDPRWEAIIPRNYAVGPGYFTVNLRLSRVFGFGASTSTGRPSSGGGGAVRAPLSDTLTEKRYNMTLSVTARNLLNRTNPATPIGVLTSALFGRANALADAYKPAPGAGNRRVEVQLRLKF